MHNVNEGRQLISVFDNSHAPSLNDSDVKCSSTQSQDASSKDLLGPLARSSKSLSESAFCDQDTGLDTIGTPTAILSS